MNISTQTQSKRIKLNDSSKNSFLDKKYNKDETTEQLSFFENRRESKKSDDLVLKIFFTLFYFISIYKLFSLL